MDELGFLVFGGIVTGVIVPAVVVLRLGITVFDYFGIRPR